MKVIQFPSPKDSAPPATGCVEQAFLMKSANVSVRQEAAGFGDFDRVFDVLEAAVATGPGCSASGSRRPMS